LGWSEQALFVFPFFLSGPLHADGFILTGEIKRNKYVGLLTGACHSVFQGFLEDVQRLGVEVLVTVVQGVGLWRGQQFQNLFVFHVNDFL
jgi:hypothetical protein